MSFNTGNISGSPVIGDDDATANNPTFEVTIDLAPALNAEQIAITSISGSANLTNWIADQVTHSADSPFTLSWFRPANYKSRPAVNPTTGVLRGRVPSNQHKIHVRKGLKVHDSVPAQLGRVSIVIDIPAGAESFDREGVEALLSATAGFLSSRNVDNIESVITGLS